MGAPSHFGGMPMGKKTNKVTVVVDHEFLGPLGLEETMIPVIYEDMRRRITESAHSTEELSDDKLFAEYNQPIDQQGGNHDE